MTQYTQSDDVTSHSFWSLVVYCSDLARAAVVQTRRCDASRLALNNLRLMRSATFPNSTLHLNVSRLRRFTCDHRTLKHTAWPFSFRCVHSPASYTLIVK